jgi:Tol biopolymer transport system component/predicted Ser/Thr protein kinase
MALSAGTRLGPYEILAPLGAGGMGEVYRARDAKLGRELALKVLPEDLSRDPERRRRFEQEARAASALNHPNVVPVYDVGTVDGVTYIAMELVEGRTLRDVVTAGATPPKKLLELAVQIADGLSRAHEAGIVHRDLKPENIMVSRDGHVRILDFGLAKLVEPKGDVSENSTSPQITRAGMVVGTLGYMSPEQAAGRSVDFRSDQFSLGTILYELASGKKPFQRATGPETLTAILREPAPPLAPLAPHLPAPLRWIVEERCLAKEREDRYASTRDLQRELVGLRDHFSEAVSSTFVSAGAAKPRRAVLATVLALLGGLGLGAVLGPRLGLGGSISPPSFRRMTFRRGSISLARFAPDGQTVVYGARFAGRPVEVFSARTDGTESRALGFPGGNLLAVSSTGEMALQLASRPVYGWENVGTLARASLAGGAPREVLENVEEADWTPDGRSFVVVRDVGGRRRLEFPVDKVLYESAGYLSHVRLSPNADRVAFLHHPIRGDNAGSVMVVDLAGQERTLAGPYLATGGLAWSPSGQEIWYSAAPAGLKGELRAVTLGGRERLLWREAGPISLHDVARDGRVLMSRSNQGREMVGLAPGAAKEQELTFLDWSYPVDLSDDGHTLLFDEEGEGAGDSYAIFLTRTDGSAPVRLGEGSALALSPDGKSVLGMSGSDLLLLPIGPGQTRKLPLGPLTGQAARFFPDGRRILLAANAPRAGVQLFVVDVASGTSRAFTGEGVDITRGSHPVSPDGRFVAGLASDSRITIYPVDGGAPRVIPGAVLGEGIIRWTADGRGLYVRPFALPTPIEIVDVATGRRTPWKTVLPADPAGVTGVSPILLSRDAKAYVYSYSRLTDDLYVVEGLR